MIDRDGICLTPEEALDRLRKHRDRYGPSCELFVRECFGFPNDVEREQGLDVYPWQSEGMAAYDAGERLMSIRSGHGVGKTTFLNWITWHQLLWRFPQISAITAPTEKQLFDAYWKGFRNWHNRLVPWIRDLVEVRADSAYLKHTPGESLVSIATARPEQPEALQGKHPSEPTGWVLLIGDEASGIHERVFEAAWGSMSTPRSTMVLTGNPVRGTGLFHDTHTRLSDKWWNRTVSCFDVPQSVSKQYIEEIADTYGVESNAYRVRVLGLPPRADDDTIMPYELVAPAVDRDVVVAKTDPVIWGLDVARFGDDRTSLAKRRTRELMEKIKWMEKKDLMETAGWVKHEWDITPGFERPQVICIDTIGLGAGVFDRLRELGLPVRAVNVSESPAATNAEKYADLTTELLYEMRNWFSAKDCRLPAYYERPDRSNNLIAELTGRKYKVLESSGKVQAESKAMMKKRGLRSPDLADAFMLTFAVEAATLAQGRYRNTNWRNKISRPLRGIV